ncbi:MAG: hypothetical protein JW808_04060 [Victivallales bacterium]|nr:hypothetical protein [Victivallales bacterium]
MPDDKLTEDEQQQVIERTRGFLNKTPSFRLSEEDKGFINTNMPKFHVDYTGRKYGHASLIWSISPTFSIRVVYSGDILEKNCLPRVTISRFK